MLSLDSQLPSSQTRTRVGVLTQTNATSPSSLSSPHRLDLHRTVLRHPLALGGALVLGWLVPCRLTLRCVHTRGTGGMPLRACSNKRPTCTQTPSQELEPQTFAKLYCNAVYFIFRLSHVAVPLQARCVVFFFFDCRAFLSLDTSALLAFCGRCCQAALGSVPLRSAGLSLCRTDDLDVNALPVASKRALV